MPTIQPTAVRISPTPYKIESMLLNVTPTVTEPPQTLARNVILEISNEDYIHPHGLFSVFPPRGWLLALEDLGSLKFESQNSSGALSIQVANTGYSLNDESFERFIEARDKNSFSVYNGYKEIEHTLDLDNQSAKVIKSLNFEDTTYIVASYYKKQGQAITSLDFWLDEFLYEFNDDTIEDIFKNINTNNRLVSEQTIYPWVYTFSNAAGTYSIDVPLSWTYQYTSANYLESDKFTSPDEHAMIQMIVYDNGVEITELDAGTFALELLRNLYVKNLRINDTRLQRDGSERIDWFSYDRNFSGYSFFDIDGSKFTMLTIKFDVEYREYYIELIESILQSYKVLE